MQKILISLFIIISTFFLNIEVRSQTLTVKNVSVINEQGHVLISWEYSGADDIVIYRDDLVNNNLSPIDTISPPANSYLDITANAHMKSRAYQIKSKTNPSSVRSVVVHTYYLTFNYDSCAQQINLSWQKLEASYIGYALIPSLFIINIDEGGIPRTENVDTMYEEYSVSNILENTNYKIYLETIWQGQDSTSRSNPISKFTEMPQSPDYINSISASVEGIQHKPQIRNRS